MTDLHLGERLDDVRRRIDAWLDEFAADNPLIAAVDRGTSDDTPFGEPRWYVRMIGDEKDFTTVWLTLGQRTLRYETYVMPAPEENEAAVMEYAAASQRPDRRRPLLDRRRGRHLPARRAARRRRVRRRARPRARHAVHDGRGELPAAPPARLREPLRRLTSQLDFRSGPASVPPLGSSGWRIGEVGNSVPPGHRPTPTPQLALRPHGVRAGDRRWRQHGCRPAGRDARCRSAVAAIRRRRRRAGAAPARRTGRTRSPTWRSSTAMPACAAAVLAVKPPDIADGRRRGRSRPVRRRLLSIAAGVTTATIDAAAGAGVAVVRTMPNTPALVGEGVSALSGAAGSRRRRPRLGGADPRAGSGWSCGSTSHSSTPSPGSPGRAGLRVPRRRGADRRRRRRRSAARDRRGDGRPAAGRVGRVAGRARRPGRSAGDGDVAGRHHGGRRRGARGTRCGHAAPRSIDAPMAGGDRSRQPATLASVATDAPGKKIRCDTFLIAPA